MKIRNGFVSNSSSSSFVVLGFTMSEEDAKDRFVQYVKIIKRAVDDIETDVDIEIETNEDNSIPDNISDALSNDGYRDITVIGGGSETTIDDGDVVVGLSIDGYNINDVIKASKRMEVFSEKYGIRQECVVISGTY